MKFLTMTEKEVEEMFKELDMEGFIKKLSEMTDKEIKNYKDW